MNTNNPRNMQQPQEVSKTTLRRRKHVAANRASAQRDKLDAQAEARAQQAPEQQVAASEQGKQGREKRLEQRHAGTTLVSAIDDYLQDHAGGNHSEKTLEWHGTALGLMRTYLTQERGITLVGEVDAPDISAWFAHLRTSPGSRGKMRSERTVQTYARSARAFFHWLMHRGLLQSNPFDRVVFPKVGKPLIQTIDAEEFERLLLACTPTNETGPIAERAAVRNRAILWVFYDTDIRISELCGLRLADFGRRRPSHCRIVLPSSPLVAADFRHEYAQPNVPSRPCGLPAGACAAAEKQKREPDLAGELRTGWIAVLFPCITTCSSRAYHQHCSAEAFHPTRIECHSFVLCRAGEL